MRKPSSVATKPTIKSIAEVKAKVRGKSVSVPPKGPTLTLQRTSSRSKEASSSSAVSLPQPSSKQQASRWTRPTKIEYSVLCLPAPSPSLVQQRLTEISPIFYIPNALNPQPVVRRESHHRAAAERMMRSLELRREASKEEVSEGVFEKDVFGSGGVSEVYFSERDDLKGCLKVVKEEREVPWYLNGGGGEVVREEKESEKKVVGEKVLEKEKVETEKEIEKEVVIVSEEEDSVEKESVVKEKESVVNEKEEKEEKKVEIVSEKEKVMNKRIVEKEIEKEKEEKEKKESEVAKGVEKEAVKELNEKRAEVDHNTEKEKNPVMVEEKVSVTSVESVEAKKEEPLPTVVKQNGVEKEPVKELNEKRVEVNHNTEKEKKKEPVMVEEKTSVTSVESVDEAKKDREPQPTVAKQDGVEKEPDTAIESDSTSDSENETIAMLLEKNRRGIVKNVESYLRSAVSVAEKKREAKAKLKAKKEAEKKEEKEKEEKPRKRRVRAGEKEKSEPKEEKKEVKKKAKVPQEKKEEKSVLVKEVKKKAEEKVKEAKKPQEKRVEKKEEIKKVVGVIASRHVRAV